ncbi:DNA polymerase III subunit gamma/tau [Moraxella nasovis]|nr:DNA polymerase III subunit gamma/tau [Moraxella nasovis]UNU73215.1 DNA polymerase III subunit gamma/tau [Moraxella nasovis]
MSEYQVLARKYRPKNFDELLGQRHVSQALSHAIDTGRLHHAYLFTGTRGVGKTTIARILAKCLNCETGVTSTPCGVCDTCVSVDSGRFIDLIEIDAASRTKVEDTRDLLENVPYAPTQGRYKVYLIDEVHMLSTHSFNALLKTLEEPPEHVKFILATTDPQKIPVTIISRCLQFVLRPLSQELLHKHLAKILKEEQICYADQAVWQLAQSAKGSVRDALSLTDQAIAFGGGQIDDATIMQMLGLVDSVDMIALIEAIYTDNRQFVASQIQKMRLQMVDATAVLERLTDTLHSLALSQIMPDLPLDMNDEQKQAFYQLASQISPDVLQLYYEIILKAHDAIRLASTPMQALEMGILRLLAFRPLTSGQALVGDTSSHLDNTPHDELSDTHQAGDKPHQNTNDESAESSKKVKMVKSDTDELIHVKSDDDKAKTPDVYELDEVKQSDEPLAIPAKPMPLDHEYVTDSLSVQVNATPIQDDLDVDSIPSPHKKTNQSVYFENTSDTRQRDAELAPLSTTNLALSDDIASDDIASDDHGQIATDYNNRLTKEQIRLKMRPKQVDLVGEWTPEKWDYWVSCVSDGRLFDNDELALIQSAQMIGQIDGDSVLHIHHLHDQTTAIYRNLKKKINDYLPNIRLADEPLMLDGAISTPYQHNLARQEQVLIDAQNQLIGSPVAVKLWQNGFIFDDGRPIIEKTKLLLD